MKNIVKKHYKILIGIIIGIIISTTIVYSAENILTGGDISYDNKTSGEDTVQGAIDELYEKAKTNCPNGDICSLKKEITLSNRNSNIVKAYKYDENSESNAYCIKGSESTCKETDCINYINQYSCSAGTIIDYQVNDTDTVIFHVVHDDGEKMTLQSQQDIVEAVKWNETGDITGGPITALAALEEKTNNWNNVNTLAYSIGDNTKTLKYSGCEGDVNCNAKTYELTKDNVKSRMITMQEVFAVGCKSGRDTCPKWMNSNAPYFSWTMSTRDTTKESSDTYKNYPYHVDLNYNATCWNHDSKTLQSVRAVVEINK